MKQRWILACVPVALSCGDPQPDDPFQTGSAEGTAGTTSEGSGTGQGPGGATESAEGTGSATTMGQLDTTAGADGPIFDVGTIPDSGNGSCQQAACGESEWSYIWIANSGEATISKVNTRTLTEEGRYYTRPDQSGNPSRTSVSIDGRAVAVANRSGGVTKLWALQEDCVDANGNGMIDTSTGGAGSMRPFAEEECVAWHSPNPAATTQRPVAWTSGTYNPVTCEYEDQMVWAAAALGMPGGTWPCTGADGIYVYRHDGDTGVVLDEIHMPDVTCGGTLGPYGAAVDFNNDLWMYIWSAFTIVHVDFETLAYETMSGGSYGITVDTSGRVWVDSGTRYDPATGMTANKLGNLPGSGGSGVAQDQQGRIWTATTGGVGWIDMETMVVGDTVPLPEGGLYRGIAVDFDGYIWAVLLGGTTAHKIDPDTYAVQTFNGLNSPYTYSDMAGGQLTSVTCNPPAG
jgi:hypothetical protein